MKGNDANIVQDSSNIVLKEMKEFKKIKEMKKIKEIKTIVAGDGAKGAIERVKGDKDNSSRGWSLGTLVLEVTIALKGQPAHSPGRN